MTKRKELPIGTISHGTLKVEDLIPVFLDAAEGLQLSKEQRKNIRGHRKEFERLTATADAEGLSNEADEELSEMMEVICQQMNDLCPTYCYFGTNEGDGSDFGVWPSDEVPLHGPATDEIGKGAELPPSYQNAPDHFLVVNDHGNATLYRKRRQGRNHRWVECWSVV